MPLSEKMSLRIGDVAKTAEERRGLEAALNLVDEFLTERLAGLSEERIGATVDTVVQAALRKHAESKLPPADPRARSVEAFQFALEGAMRREDRISELLSRFGDCYPGLTGDRARVLARSTLTTGSTGMSYVLPTPVADEIQVYAREATPILGVVRRYPVPDGGGIAGSIPCGTSTRPTTYIVAQGSGPTDSVIQPGTFAYSLLKFATGIPVSSQLWAYSVPAFQAWVIAEAAYSHAIKQHSQLAVGTNSSQWQGLETASITQVTTGSALEADLIGATFLAVPGMHRPRGVWTCSETTLGYIWALKDGDGRRLLPFDTVKMELFGRPIYTNSAHTDGVLYFGDPTRYVVAHGRFMVFTIAPGNGYTTTNADIVYFYLGEDLDGGVSDTNAWRYCVLTGA